MSDGGGGFLDYPILYTPYSILSFPRNRLIEVEGEARDDGPGGELGQVGAGGGFELADAQELLGVGRMLAVVGAGFGERLAQRRRFAVVALA